MATTGTPSFPKTIKGYVARIQAADTTTLVTLATGGADGTVINSLSIASSDASSRVMRFWRTRSAIDYCIGAITIPGNSGYSGSAATINAFTITTFNLQGPFDASGNRTIQLESGDTLRVSLTTTTTNPLFITADGVDY